MTFFPAFRLTALIAYAHPIVILLAAAALGRAAEPLEARWDGTIQIPGNELHVVIDLAKNPATVDRLRHRPGLRREGRAAHRHRGAGRPRFRSHSKARWASRNSPAA